MATSNYHIRNASRAFSILESYRDEESGEWITPESFEYDDEKDYIKERLVEVFKGTKYSFTEDDRHSPEALRSYPATILGSAMASRTFMGVNVEVNVIAVIRSGYYDGCNLDWYPEYYTDGTTDEDEDEAMISFRIASDYEGNNPGLTRANEDKLRNWYQQEKSKLVELVEKVFTEVSTPLIVVGTFSNGETIYQKA